MSLRDAKETAQQSKPSERKYTQRIRLLWVGLATCILIVLNDVRYVLPAPNYVVMLALLIYGGIALIFALELRKIYGRRKKLRLGSPD